MEVGGPGVERNGGRGVRGTARAAEAKWWCKEKPREEGAMKKMKCYSWCKGVGRC